MSKKCSSCGEIIEDDYKFCPVCGEATNKQVINQEYKLPSNDILNKPKDIEIDNSPIEENIKKIELGLKSFSILAKVTEVHIGPKICEYEMELANAKDVTKISKLTREMSMVLAKSNLKIEAPIPGKSTVGIVFANEEHNAISFYEMMASKVMEQSKERPLMVPLGKTPIGDMVICELNKMPHLLISGTTGSGKTVLLNNIICSILMRAKPDEVKLALIDTKLVEFSCYNGVPHLLCSVVNDPKQAAILLRHIVNEVEKRYNIFNSTGTKQIEEFNEYVRKYNELHPEEKLGKMHYIVVVIDDLADLMMVAAKEVEDSILRITQKARAAGVHLVISSQRPSGDVLTEIIKTNIPSRISFVVSSRADSLVILDQLGAEDLTGHGDMLYLPVGMKKPINAQCTIVHDNEINKIVEYVKEQQEAYYDNSFLEIKEEPVEKSAAEIREESDDALYNEIVDFVVKSGKASASLLQRKFRIGYNKAATMIDELEANGIIGPYTGKSSLREVLVKYSDNK